MQFASPHFVSLSRACNDALSKCIDERRRNRRMSFLVRVNFFRIVDHEGRGKVDSQVRNAETREKIALEPRRTELVRQTRRPEIREYEKRARAAPASKLVGGEHD